MAKSVQVQQCGRCRLPIEVGQEHHVDDDMVPTCRGCMRPLVRQAPQPSIPRRHKDRDRDTD